MFLYYKIKNRLSENLTEDGRLVVETMRFLIITSTLFTVFSLATLLIIIFR